MSPLISAVDAFLTAAEDTTKSANDYSSDLNALHQKLRPHSDSASLEELDAALARFAIRIPKVRLLGLGGVAITCGGFVERGGDPNIAGKSLLQRLPELSAAASDFYVHCRNLASADPDVIEKLRANCDEKDLTPQQLLEYHVNNEGWEQLFEMFRKVLYYERPQSLFGFRSEEYFRLGLIAHLSRSKTLRATARSNPEYLRETCEVDELSFSHRSFLQTMLRVLDDESLLVLHVDQKKGFDVRISGIADNFQLHVLLAGAIIGSAAKGWVKGETPSSTAIAECRDADLAGQGSHVIGPFNLLNWTALRSDGTLPDGYSKDAVGQWIWNEGWPAEIAPFEGRRVVLIGPSPYSRGWRAGRQFSGMHGELEVERILDVDAVTKWIQQISRAPRI